MTLSTRNPWTVYSGECARCGCSVSDDETLNDSSECWSCVEEIEFTAAAEQAQFDADNAAWEAKQQVAA